MNLFVDQLYRICIRCSVKNDFSPMMGFMGVIELIYCSRFEF